MGVMSCDRKDCGNVMCSRISHIFNAYICDECFEELVKLGVKTDIHQFLESPKLDVDDEEATRLYFETIFKKIEF